uniref:Uncharacterized protein n=1 Tax=Glossina pallidipes TaxID=7398 RepID=A0A1A9ZUD5_GLOPL
MHLNVIDKRTLILRIFTDGIFSHIVVNCEKRYDQFQRFDYAPNSGHEDVAEPDEMRSLRLRPSLSRERPSITAGKQANIITEIIGRRDMTLYLAGANILVLE